MIFTERTIKISNDVCNIDEPIVLYRGDHNVEARFTIINCPYKYTAKNSTNIIEAVDASYGQLVIKVPNDGSPIFSDVVETKGGSIVFTLSREMIDESIEVGDYTFQIRLFDANKESRATIPPVENGISIREPIAFEDVTTTNEVGVATVGYALTTAAIPEDAFDSQGNYNKTNWKTGDRITAEKLNKIEQGITGVNNKVPHYNETLITELSGDDYNSLTNNNYFNINALNLGETNSYVGKVKMDINSDEEFICKFVYDKTNNALIDEISQTYIYNHKSYDGTNFIEDENSAVITIGITTFGTGGDGYFRLYEIDNLRLDTNCLPDNVSIPNSLTVGNRIGDIGEFSVAEGDEVIASGNFSHAEGVYTEATGNISHAEGGYTTASGDFSHAEGYDTTASSDYQHVQGKYSINDTENKYAHIVGNGTSYTARSNAHTLDWQGNAWYQGNVSVNGTPTNDNDLTTKKYVDDAINNAQMSGGSNINDTTASATTTYSSNKIETIIGSATLNTSAQDLKGAINEVFQNVSNGKQLIATAITDKGVATSSNSTFQTMADNIKNISSANINVEGFTEYTLFETDEAIPDTWIGANNGKNLVLSSDDFLNTFYDNLITNNSDYGTITKTALGKDESQTYTIYEYDFKPKNWNRMILLSSGMHPYELPAPFGLAYFMKYVMTSDDVAMKYIRENVRIKVIPIINPWGWNQNPRKYGTVNGVNINRNFDPMGLWERYNGNTTEWNQKGTSAYSENETKILRNWLSRNKGTEFYIDCHTGYNAFATDVTNALYYLSDSPIKTQIESALTKLNNWITSKFGVTGKANSNRAQNPTGVFDYGVTDYAEKELGIPAFTIEQRPESTVFGTTAVNEGADIKHYMTSISTYVMELLLKQPEHITQSTVIQMKQSIIELNKDEANYITLEGGTTPIEPTEPIEPIQLEKFDINLSNINSGDTSITDSTNNKTLDIVGTDWTKNDDGSITFGAKSSLRYDGGLCTENNKVFTVVLDMSAKLSTSGTKYAMLWGDFNSDTEGIFFMCDNKQFYFKDFSKGNGAQAVYAGALARDKYLLICNGSQIILRTKTRVLSAGSLNDLTIPAHNKVYFGNTNTLSKNMDCKLYEIKWYNKALSDEEIQAL